QKSRCLLLDIRQRLSGVELILNVEEINNYEIHFSRLNKRFEVAFNLAKLFFAGKSLQVRVGDTTSYAFVFDMNMIFQNFITNFIIQHRRKIFQDFNHKPVINRQKTNKPTYLTFDPATGNKFFFLNPDIFLEFPFSKIPRLVIDTKYKVLNPGQPSWGISRDDIYQMLAYSIGFTTENLVLLYPRPLLQPIHKRLDITKGDVDSKIYIQTVNLHQPLENPINMINDLKLVLQSILGGN
ncbi:MAG: 5-methylcytosine restriction system specificity protein McrC, partial [Promethearchaeota archaeon]